MRSRLAWVAGGFGLAGAAALRTLTRRRRPARADEAPAGPDPRAEELRRRLEESRSIVEEREEFEAGETPVDEAEPESLEERRARVHREAREAAREMRGPDAG